MNIAPGMQPAQMSYEPLNLQQFAYPLAMKEKQFQETIASGEAMDLGIDALSPDGERSSELSGQFKADRDAIIENLDKTKNYTEAARKLKQLNKIYHSHPEALGLRQQKQEFLAADERMKEKVKKGEVNEDRYARWKRVSLLKYGRQGGYGYDEELGMGNNINLEIIENDRWDDLMKTSADLAKSTPSQREVIFKELGYDTESDSFKTLTRDLEGREYEQVRQEVYNHLRNNPNYKTFLDQESKFEYWDNVFKQPETFAFGVIENAGKELMGEKARLDQIENTLAQRTKTGTKEEREAAQQQLEQAQQRKASIEDQLRGLYDTFQTAAETGQIEELGERIYGQSYADKALYDIAGTASDLYDFNNTKESLSTRKGGSGGSRAKLAKIKDITVNSGVDKFLTSNFEDWKTTIGVQLGASDTETTGKDTYLARINEIEVEELEYFDELSELGVLNKEEAEGLNKDLKLYSGAVAIYDDYNKKEEKLKTELKQIEEKLNDPNSNLDLIEARNLKAAQKENQTLLNTYRQTRDRDLNYFENSLYDYATTSNDSEVKEAVEKGSYEEGYRILKERTEKSKDIISEQAKRYFEIINKEDPLRFDPSVTSSLLDVNLLLTGKERRTVKRTPEEIQAVELSKDYLGKGFGQRILEELSTEYNTVRPFVINDEGASKYTKGVTKLVVDDIIARTGSGETPTVVKFNPATVETEELLGFHDGWNWDVNRYSDKGARILDIDQSEGVNNYVVKLFRNPIDDSKKVAYTIDKLQTGEDIKKLSETKRKEYIDLFNSKVPESISLKINNTSHNVLGAAKNTFAEQTEVALGEINRDFNLNPNNIQTAKGYSELDKTLTNYSHFDLLGNAQMARDYNGTAARLKQIAEKQDTSNAAVHYSGPTHFKQTPDGRTVGYSITTRYSPERRSLVAVVAEENYNEKGVMVGKPSPKHEIVLNQGATAVELRKLDIMYGAGNGYSANVLDSNNRNLVPIFDILK